MISPQSQQTHTLQTLLQGFDLFSDDGKIPVSGLSMDSRRVEQGDLFFAVTGSSQHGKEYIDDAVAKGAIGVVSDHAIESSSVPVAVLPGLQTKISGIASRFYGEPSQKMWVVGVTGTNGKTSVSQFVAQALNEKGLCGVIGTLGYGLPDEMVDSTHTTPDPIRLQSLLAEMVAKGADQVVMEVSSHGLEQGRVAGVHFDAAVFTNLSRDHLDYHQTMESYAAAKRKLFEMAGLKYAVINAGDEQGRSILASLEEGVTAISYALADELSDGVAVDLLAEKIDFGRHGVRFHLASRWGNAVVEAGLLGAFNVSNLLAVLGVLLVSGIDLVDAVGRVKRLTTVSGRMEKFEQAGLPVVVVDYAHTPDALHHALEAARLHCKGKLWCLFGCGGDRDQGKRPMMGKIAEQLADHVVLTDDNPRHEQAAEIVAQIQQGMESTHTVIHDRAEAIDHVVSSAKADDLVLVAGKGHESYQQFNDEKRPFSDREQVRSVLQKYSRGVAENG